MKRIPIILLATFLTSLLVYISAEKPTIDILKKTESDYVLESIGKKIIIDKKTIVLGDLKKPIVVHFCVSWSYFCEEEYAEANLLVGTDALDFYYIDLSEKADKKKKGYKKLLREFNGKIIEDKKNILISKFLVHNVPATFKLQINEDGELEIEKIEKLKNLL